MKKTFLKLAAFMLAAVMMSCMFVSCAKKISGTYEADITLLGQGMTVTYTFSGSKFEATNEISILGQGKTNSVSGTYEIIEYDDGSMEIKLDFEEETTEFQNGTYSFEDGESYIKIGGVKYTKIEK